MAATVSLPESIKVGIYTYTVIRQPMEDFGQSEHRRLVITIGDDLAPIVERETLLHEIMHAVYHAAGRIMSRDDDPDEASEQVIRLWTGHLLGVLRDNPGLVAYLTTP